MADMFDYLQWRGDIPFSQVPVNPVDALVFSTLCYLHFEDVVPNTPHSWITLRDAAEALLALPDAALRTRVPKDLELLEAAAKTQRFGRAGLAFYQSILIPEEETQFAAMTFYLDDGSAFLAFRGTDSTLVGWKEDFNMTFQESVPAQRKAAGYLDVFAGATAAPLYLGGHSKGGNLAVYAAAKCLPNIQDRLLAVYNHDGPGFTERMMYDPGYLRIVPKIRTNVPQSSVFGMLLDHEEPYRIVRSTQIGLMQHDPYSWEVMGGDFVLLEELTADSKFLDRTFRGWLEGMTIEERNRFFDSVFDLLALGDASRPRDILDPKNLRTYFKALGSDKTMRDVISAELHGLLEAAKNAHQPSNRSEIG